MGERMRIVVFGRDNAVEAHSEDIERFRIKCEAEVYSKFASELKSANWIERILLRRRLKRLIDQRVTDYIESFAPQKGLY